MKPKSLLDRQLGILFAVGTGGELTDGQLLERFSTREHGVAEQAFETLVHRHGPMVLRACRALLADSHDAEDAFQATFLVLARQAKRLWVSDSIGPWLHQVAVRTSGSLRRANARRRRHEGLAEPARLMAAPEPSDDDIERLVHEELNRLPERFRVPVVLCDLEGQTHEQAARNLGLPVGTVKSRLSRARERLRGQLARRGLSPESVTAALAVGRSTGLALTDSLVSTTSAAALRFITTGTTLGGTAALLAKGVLSAMLMTRFWKAAAILLVAATVSGAGLIGELRSSRAGQVKSATNQPTSPAPVAPTSDQPETKEEIETYLVKSSTSPIIGNGVIEAAKRSDVINPIENVDAMVLSLVPEGTHVKAGDPLGEIDPSALRGELAQEEEVLQQRTLELENAKHAREIAILALKEFEEGVLPSERSLIQGEITIAESNLQRSQARLERAKAVLQKVTTGRNEPSQNRPASELLAELDLADRVDTAEQSVQKDRLSIESSRGKLATQELASAKTIRELNAEIERKATAVRVSQEKYDSQSKRIEQIENQIKACKLTASADGIVIHLVQAAKNARFYAPRGQGILLSILDDKTPSFVEAAFSSSHADRLKLGQEVRVGLTDHSLVAKGKVVRISPLLNSQGRQMATIQLINASKQPRPGLQVVVTATVDNDEWIIPAKAIARKDGKNLVAVKKADGGFEMREVQIDGSNGKNVHVSKGMNTGDRIALNPGPILFGPGWKEDQQEDSSEGNEGNPENAPQ